MSSTSEKQSAAPSIAPSTSTVSTLRTFTSRMHVPLLGFKSDKSKKEPNAKQISKPEKKKELTVEDVLDKAAMHSMMSGGAGLGK